MAVLMLLCSIRIRWVQSALIFLMDFFPITDFDFTCLFNFCTSFFSLYSQSGTGNASQHGSQQCLSICPSNSCHLIACAAYILANMSKPTRMSKPSQLESYFDKPLPHSDSYSIHNVTEQSEHSPMQLAIDVFHFKPPCSQATGVAQPCLVPQMASFTRANFQ